MNLLELLLAIVRDKKSFLEVGCGYGANCHEIKKQLPGLRVVGVDIAKKPVEFAKEKFKGVEYLEADARRLPFKKNEFDIVFTHGLLIHISFGDIYKSLKKIMRAAKMGIFVESSADKEKNGVLKYDPKSYWNGRYYRDKPNEIDEKTQYYYSHDYKKLFTGLNLKWEVLYDFNDGKNTRIYKCSQR